MPPEEPQRTFPIAPWRHGGKPAQDAIEMRAPFQGPALAIPWYVLEIVDPRDCLCVWLSLGILSRCFLQTSQRYELHHDHFF